MKNLMNKKMSRKMNNKKKGFTLIELVVVILIIAILAVVLIPQLSAMTNKAKTSGVQEAFREFQIASQTVCIEQNGFGKVDNSAYLKDTVDNLNKNLDAVNQLTAAPDAASATLTRQDPWGNAYTVKFYKDAAATTAAAADDAVAAVQFISNGADGTAGNADDLSTTIAYEEGSYKVTTEGFSLNAK